MIRKPYLTEEDLDDFGYLLSTEHDVVAVYKNVADPPPLTCVAAMFKLYGAGTPNQLPVAPWAQGMGSDYELKGYLDGITGELCDEPPTRTW